MICHRDNKCMTVHGLLTKEHPARLKKIMKSISNLISSALGIFMITRDNLKLQWHPVWSPVVEERVPDGLVNGVVGDIQASEYHKARRSTGQFLWKTVCP